MRIYINMVQMVVPRKKLTQVYPMKGINMVYLILDNPCSSTKVRLVKKLSNLERVIGRRSQHEGDLIQNFLHKGKKI